MSEEQTKSKMKALGGVVSTIVFLVVAYAIARGVLFPRVVVDETVEVRKGTYYFFAYTPTSTNRKLMVDVESLNGTGVEVAILSPGEMANFDGGKLELDDAASGVEGAYSPALIEGSVERYITADDEWSIVVVSNNRDAQVKLKAKTLLRF